MVCHRASLPPAVDWFNRSSNTLDADEWVPKSSRVLHSPADVPPGSLLDPSLLQGPFVTCTHDEVSDEVVVGQDMETVLPPLPVSVSMGDDTLIDELPSSPRRVGIPTVDAATAQEILSVRRAYGDDLPGSMDFTDCLWVRDPVPTIPMVSSRIHSRVSTFTLADSGSNVCLTNDLTILEDVHDIPPRPLDVAVTGSDSMCTKSGFVTFTFTDGTVHRQPFLYNKQASETILSPQHITKRCPHISTWVQGGSGDNSESGYLLFYGLDRSTVVMSLPLVTRNGLYYYNLPGESDEVVHDSSPGPPSSSGFRVNKVNRPVSASDQLTSELWAARLGYCGTEQLGLIPSHVVGTPSQFKCHPFRFLDVKEDARIQRQPRGVSDDSVLKNGEQFHMDFGFIRASSADYGVTPPVNA